MIDIQTYLAIVVAVGVLIVLYESSECSKMSATQIDDTPSADTDSTPVPTAVPSIVDFAVQVPAVDVTTLPASPSPATVIDKKAADIENTMSRYGQAMRKLQDKYSFGWGKYEYEPVPNEYPLNGLGPDYNQHVISSLKTGCNRTLADPDFNFNYTNFLR
jgi:hypothetical protein